MATHSKHKNTDNKRENPASHFTKPSEVANDRKLSHGDKRTHSTRGNRTRANS